MASRFRTSLATDREFPAWAKPIGLLLGAAVLFLVGVAVGSAGNAGPAPASRPPPEGPHEDPDEGRGPGPSRIEAGVPVGYERTEAGAVAAAANYVVALGGVLLLDPSGRVDAFGAVALPEARNDLEKLASGIDLVVEQLDLEAIRSEPGFVFRTLPAGYRLEAYDHDIAVVEVWANGVFVAAGRQPRIPSAWRTTTVRLRWQDGDWRITGLEGEDGPVPTQSGDEPGADLVGRLINRFEEFWYAASDR